MKITRLRHNGQKVTSQEQDTLGALLVNELYTHGYITHNVGLQSIGLRMRSFKIDTARIGHNKRSDEYNSTLVDFKKTDVPTWEQRVEYNDIINNFFDRHNLTAKVVSGPYTVRHHETGSRCEWDWGSEIPGYYDDTVSTLTAEDIESAKAKRKEHNRIKRLERKESKSQRDGTNTDV